MTSITVITSTLNALADLKRSAASILTQSHASLQWVIVDAASTDGTTGWLQITSADHPSVQYISEPDDGIYDAWNKGLMLATGKWVLFLGAGDRLKNSNTLACCSMLLGKVSMNMNLAYGFVEYVDKSNEPEGRLNTARWEGVNGRWTWCRPMMPNHQATFHRREFVCGRGGFDNSYRIAGDTAKNLPELIENGAYEMQVTVALRARDGTSLDCHNRSRVLKEVLRINRAVGLGRKRLVYQYTAYCYHVAKCWWRVARARA